MSRRLRLRWQASLEAAAAGRAARRKPPPAAPQRGCPVAAAAAPLGPLQRQQLVQLLPTRGLQAEAQAAAAADLPRLQPRAAWAAAAPAREISRCRQH